MMELRTQIRDATYPGASLLGDEEAEAVARVMRERSLFRYYGLSEPREVAAYEDEWAAHVGVAHALAVNSGTSALFCALVAAGVEPGDEVILPAFAWSSDANVVLQLGALPVIADVDDTLTLDPAAAQAALTERTAAIVPVHMRGAPAAMDELRQVADGAGVALVEDACQAAGVKLGGRPAGSFGLVAAFSTQYAKIVVTGEGGVVVTDDESCHVCALDAHDPGASLRRGSELSAYPGLNLRCTELQAAVGRVQLRRLDGAVEVMRASWRRIAAAVESREELVMRRLVDGAEPNGVAVIFFAPSAEAARATRDSLREQGVSATVLHEPGVPDLHVADSWQPVHAALERMGGPEPRIDASLDLLGRGVQIDVHPLFEEEDVDAICAAVERLP
jgi:8-amino-3,8-dideoxy-alpha-D-manno-octulosonate transaminase